ncbi:uncharacterized protein LOC135128812 [Zophobas morio]|uniref:uncharacterized protein LOC135128812 n=1 Tax=Zophobas morio TaxID=2755281 RepID=UPI0030832DAB
MVTAKNGNYVYVKIPTNTELIATKLLDLHGLPLSKYTLNGLYYLFANNAPSKHLWDILGKRTEALQHPPATLPELTLRLTQEWQEIDQEEVIIHQFFSYTGLVTKRAFLDISLQYKRNRNVVLKEKDEVVAWRGRYLCQVKKFREEGKKLFFLNETWGNAGHTTIKKWEDSTISSSREAFLNGLSTGLKDPSEKRKKFIILHIGSEDGFVEGGLLMFESKKQGDYHEEMNSEVFENWFAEILPKLDKEAVIIIDNASYHSRKSEKVSNASTRKADVQAWLTKNETFFEEDMIKAELLVKAYAPRENRYVVDDIAEASGHKVLRLPPYHCEFNPIELIWAQTKNFVAQNWKKAIQHVVKVEAEIWDMDQILELQVEPLIINLSEESDSWDEM